MEVFLAHSRGEEAIQPRDGAAGGRAFREAARQAVGLQEGEYLHRSVSSVVKQG